MTASQAQGRLKSEDRRAPVNNRQRTGAARRRGATAGSIRVLSSPQVRRATDRAQGWPGSFALTARGSHAMRRSPAGVDHTRPARPAKQTAAAAARLSTGRASPSALPLAYALAAGPSQAEGLDARTSRAVRAGTRAGWPSPGHGRASTCSESAPSPQKVRRMPVSDQREPTASLTHKRRSRP